MSDKRYVEEGTDVEIANVNFVVGKNDTLLYNGMSDVSYETFRVWDDDQDDWIDVRYDSEGRLYYYE